MIDKAKAITVVVGICGITVLGTAAIVVTGTDGIVLAACATPIALLVGYMFGKKA